MENLLNFQENSGGMLMLETQQRAIGSKTTVATVSDTSAGEPPSPLINIGGARFHPQIPQSYHHALQPKGQFNHEQHHRRHRHHFTEENIQEDLVSKSSRSPLNLSHEHATVGHALGSAAEAASAAAAAVCCEGAESDIWKCGYLRKQKHGHKRFFVLRGPSHTGPSRLEYYDSEKKFRNSLRSVAAASSSACPPKRVIYLYQCFTVNKRADAKNKYLIALYTKDEYFAMVAESEQEQVDWYLALSDLMNEGRKEHLDPDDLDDGYGTVTPGVGFKEVWQVNVKPKGLGQTKNLTGVYRLCLTSKSIHLVKLNSDTPCINLQLMNIRRCGHSESFFFMEVGRSSSTGPGEIWMQVDDSVVAQNMHETILETMKALKAFTEFRPRSKSQSGGSNPIAFITTRRHLGNLPPSQTGLQRRSRMETVSGTPPNSKSSTGNAYRFRTSSEGESTMNRPFRSVTGSMIHLNSTRGNPGRQESTGGRYPRTQPGSAYHTRSASLPVSHFPSTTSPVSMSSSSGHGSASDTITRPSSSSLCGSPSDGGFNSSDEYGSSPGDFRYFRVRSNTPDSMGNTPPIWEEHCLSDYMAMDRHREELDPTEIQRDGSTYTSRPAGGSSVATGHQKMTQTTSLEDCGVEASSVENREQQASSSSPNPHSSSYPGPYCHTEPPTLSDLHQNPADDDGYMPMMPGMVPSSQSDYMPMQPRPRPPCQPGPRVSPLAQADSDGYMMMLPPGHASPAPVQRDITETGEYVDMSHSSTSIACRLSGERHCTQRTAESPTPFSAYLSLPRTYKAPVQHSSPRRPVCADAESSTDILPSVCADAESSTDILPSVCAAAESSTDILPSVCADAESSTDILPSVCAAAESSTDILPSVCAAAESSTDILPSVCAAAESITDILPSVCAAAESIVDCVASDPSAIPPHSLGEDLLAVRPTCLSLGDHRASEAAYPPSPGEYINIEFRDQPPHPSCTLCTEPLPSPPGPSPLQEDYLSLPHCRSPRPSLVAPWNPPSYTRAVSCASALEGGGERTENYTEMTFGLAGGSRSPTLVPQPHCIVGQQFPTQQAEPKVIRATPQGRRRHSSETFPTSVGGATSTPALPGPRLTDGAKWHSSASFDSVWLRMEGVASPDDAAPPLPLEGPSSPSGPARPSAAVCQDTLNYIALDLKEDPHPPPAPHPPSVSHALPENRPYASIDFSTCEQRAVSSKD